MAANLPTCNICKSIIEQTKQRRKLNPPCPGVNEEARRFYGDFVNPAFKALASHEDYYVCRKDFLLLERAQKAQITVQTIIRDMKLSIGVPIDTSASESELDSSDDDSVQGGSTGTVSSGLSGFSKLPEGASSPPLTSADQLPVSKSIILGRRKLPADVSLRISSEPASKRKRVERRSNIPKPKRYSPLASYKTPQSQVKVCFIKHMHAVAHMIQ